MRILFKDLGKDLKYTWEHKKAFLITEKRILGKNTLAGYLHDTDKLFLYLLFTKKETGVIHRSYAKHHTGNHKTELDKKQALIDWECARLTKKDKQETAKQYLLKYIPEWKGYYKKTMKELQLW